MEIKKGFTLIELILVISIISILLSIGLFITYTTYDKARFTITLKKMDILIKGIIGDENLIESNSRVSFGYVGDTNSLPTTLDDLVTNPGVPGWNGPYVDVPYSEDPESFKRDGWGNLFEYSPVNGTITSYGADGVSGGTGYNADITRYIYEPLTNLSNNNIRVYVKDRNNNTLTNTHVSVSISLPSGSSSLTYNTGGYFEMTNMWIGNYTITVTPSASYPELGSSMVSKISVYPKGSSSYSYHLVKFPTALNITPIPIQYTFLAQGAAYRWFNQPNALREIFSSTRHRTRIDLTNANQARLIVNVVVAGATNAQIRAQYSTNLINWYYLDGVSGPSVSIGSTGLKVSSWVNINSSAKQDVYIRLVGIYGNGRRDPRFGNIHLQIR